jgi:hypothetical protein
MMIIESFLIVYNDSASFIHIKIIWKDNHKDVVAMN